MFVSNIIYLLSLKGISKEKESIPKDTLKSYASRSNNV